MSIVVANEQNEYTEGLPSDLGLNYAEKKFADLRKAFLSNIAHEIKTPANAIVGFSNLLTDHFFSEEEKTDFYSIIQRSTLRLIHTVDNIVEMSRIQTSQVECVISEFSITKLMRDVLNSLLYIFQTDVKRVSIFTDFPDENILIRTDRSLIRVIIANLLENALKFTFDGNIYFSCKLSSMDRVEICVTDTGIGFPLENKTDVFLPFCRTTDDSPYIIPGLGIGLAICKHYSELIGGKLQIDSQNGVGTNVYLIFEQMR